MPASFVWQPGPNGGTPTNAANLNKLAVVADIGTAGTPTGDAGRAAFVPLTGQVAQQWSLSSDGTTRQIAAQAPSSFGAITDVGWQPLTVDPGVTHQPILGFGAALTDSSAYLLQTKLTQAQRTALLTDAFSPTQGNLSIVRIVIGQNDVVGNTVPANATYDDMPTGSTDPTLANFSIAVDQMYRVATLREILAINPRVRIIASMWSPPAWMKTDPTQGLSGSTVPTGNYTVLANYFVKFLQAYEALGLPIYAVCPQNEPGQVNPWPSCQMTAANQATFIGTYLGPAIDTAGLNTRIWCYDDSWATNATYVGTVMGDATAGPFVDGAAYHWYSGDPSAMKAYWRRFPTKTQIVSEAVGTGGAMTVASAYSKLFIGSMRNYAAGVVLWQLALDETGHPGVTGGEVDIYTIPSSGSGAWTRNVNYWAMAQTSRFVRPGAVRVSSSSYSSGIQTVAYLNPDASVVLVAWNSSASAITTQVIDARSRQGFPLTVPAGEVVTLSWSGTAAGSAALSITAPGAPTLAAAASKGHITLTITAGSVGGGPSAAVQIARGTAAGQETLLTTVAPGTTSYVDTVTPGSPFYYKARTLNAGGWSAYSAEVSATATAYTAPTAPGLAVAAGNQTVTLTITAPTDTGGQPLTSLQVFRGTSAGVATTGTPAATLAGAATSYTDTGLTNGTTYYYKVVAVTSAGSTASTEQSATPAFVETRVATKPSTTTQPALWLRSDQIVGVANGAAVTTWADATGNGHTGTVPNGASAPLFATNAVNSLPAVQIRSASTQKLLAPYALVAENITVFLVMRAPTSATVGVCTGTLADATTAVNYTPNVYRDTGGLLHAQVVNVASSNAASTSIGTNAWGIAAFSYDVATAHAQKMVVNGNTIGQYAPGAYTVGTAAAGLGFTNDLDLAEVIIFPAVLSDADRHSWTVYLSQVYGITIGAN